MADQVALSADDYAALHAMQMSSDPSQQAQASALAKKLTPAEQSEFFDYQKSQHPQGERGRVDNSVLGVPPELAAVGLAGVANAVTQPAISAVQRVAAGARSVASQAAPVVKYEVAKTTMEKMGVPTPLAMAAAMAISGYKKGGAPTAAAAPSTPIAEGYDRFMPNSSAISEATIPADVAKIQQLIAPAHEAVAARHAAGEIGDRAFQASQSSLQDADVVATKSLIAQGVSPSIAAQKASGGNPARFTQIMKAFMLGGAK